MTTNTAQAGGANLAATLASVAAVAAFLVLPLLIEASQRSLALDATQVGLLASATMIGSTLAALGAGLWVRRVDWRLAMRLSFAGLVASNAAALACDGFIAFAATQALAGFCGGSAYSLALTVLSDDTRADRWFGISVAAQVAFQVVGLYAGHELLDRAGLDGVLLAFIVLQLAALACAGRLPHRGRTAPVATAAARLWRPATVLALGGCLLFFFNVGAYWTYVEVIGKDGGFAPQALATALAAGVSFGMLGAGAASLLGDRHGHVFPLALAALLTVAAAAALWSPGSLAIYFAGIALYNFAWNYSLAYQYAAVNGIDPGGRAVALAPAFHGLGGALGPAVAALLVGSQGLGIVPLLAGGGAMLSLALFLLALRRPRQSSADGLAGAADRDTPGHRRPTIESARPRSPP